MNTLTREQMNAIIEALHKVAKDHDSYELGLPIWDEGKMALMREAIADALSENNE